MQIANVMMDSMEAGSHFCMATSVNYAGRCEQNLRVRYFHGYTAHTQKYNTMNELYN